MEDVALAVERVDAVAAQHLRLLVSSAMRPATGGMPVPV